MSKSTALALKSDKVNKLAKTLQVSVTIAEGLAYLATLLSGEVKPVHLATAFDAVYDIKKTVERLDSMAKKFIVDRLLKEGAEVGESGSRTMAVGKYELEIRKTGAALPDKDLEGLLRSKDLDPEVWMDPDIKYKVNLSKLEKLLREGHITQDELDSIKPEQKWAVQKPRYVDEPVR